MAGSLVAFIFHGQRLASAIRRAVGRGAVFPVGGGGRSHNSNRYEPVKNIAHRRLDWVDRGSLMGGVSGIQCDGGIEVKGIDASGFTVKIAAALDAFLQ